MDTKDKKNNSSGEWRTAITQYTVNQMWVRGYPIEDLIGGLDFGATVFLILVGRLPSEAEGKLTNAILVSGIDGSVASPAAQAARNITAGARDSFQACVAGGLLALGYHHGGEVDRTAQMVQDGVTRMKQENLSSREVAEGIVNHYRKIKEAIPGLGHPWHTVEPRAAKLFEVADELGLAGEHLQLMKDIEAVAKKQIGEHSIINAYGSVGVVLSDMLQIDPVMARGFFIISRIAGLVAQVYEEMQREVPMRTVHIDWTYDGPEKRRL